MTLQVRYKGVTLYVEGFYQAGERSVGLREQFIAEAVLAGHEDIMPLLTSAQEREIEELCLKQIC